MPCIPYKIFFFLFRRKKIHRFNFFINLFIYFNETQVEFCKIQLIMDFLKEKFILF